MVLCISLLLMNFLAAKHVVLWKHHLHYYCTLSRWQCHYVSFYENEIITKMCRVQSVGNACFNQPSRREAKNLAHFLLTAEAQIKPKAQSSTLFSSGMAPGMWESLRICLLSGRPCKCLFRKEASQDFTSKEQIICGVSCFLVTFRERDGNQIASVSNELLYKLSTKVEFSSLA